MGSERPTRIEIGQRWSPRGVPPLTVRRVDGGRWWSTEESDDAVPYCSETMLGMPEWVFAGYDPGTAPLAPVSRPEPVTDAKYDVYLNGVFSHSQNVNDPSANIYQRGGHRDNTGTWEAIPYGWDYATKQPKSVTSSAGSAPLGSSPASASVPWEVGQRRRWTESQLTPFTVLSANAYRVTYRYDDDPPGREPYDTRAGALGRTELLSNPGAPSVPVTKRLACMKCGSTSLLDHDDKDHVFTILGESAPATPTVTIGVAPAEAKPKPKQKAPARDVPKSLTPWERHLIEENRIVALMGTQRGLEREAKPSRLAESKRWPMSGDPDQDIEDVR